MLEDFLFNIKVEKAVQLFKESQVFIFFYFIIIQFQESVEQIFFLQFIWHFQDLHQLIIHVEL